MQQLPLPIKDASHNYATHNYFEPNEIQASKSSFEAGAEWQQGQYKYLLTLVALATQELDLLGPVDLSQKITHELNRLTPE